MCIAMLALVVASVGVAMGCSVGSASDIASESREPIASVGSAAAPLTSLGVPLRREFGAGGAAADKPEADGADDRGEGAPADRSAADAAPRPASQPVVDDAHLRTPSSVDPPGGFGGLVWLSTEWSYAADGPADEVVAWLDFLDLSADVPASRSVPLAGFRPQCFGQLGLVARGLDGIETGEMSEPGGGASFFVPWGGEAQRLDLPSPPLAAEVSERPSNVEFSVEGDVVTLRSGGSSASYAMRTPPRAEGDWWQVQVRHDGPLLILTVHPAHLECYSGVTWVSVADTGRVLGCGANTAAFRWLPAELSPSGRLRLPDAAEMGDVLDCAARLTLPPDALAAAIRE